MNSSPMRPPRREPRLRAFTLIELLTVIAIIGILASLVIVTVGKVRSSAHAANCRSNLRQIYVGIQLHADDHKGRLPGPLYMAQSPRYYYSESSGSVTSNLAGLLRNYIGGSRSDPAAGTGRWYHPIFACSGWVSAGGPDTPSASSNSAASYVINLTPWPGNLIISGGNDFHPFGNSNKSPAGDVPRRMDELNRLPLSRTWMLADADNEFVVQAMDYGTSTNYLAGPAHGSARSVLFFDGHVESLTPQNFMKRLN
jgi:prepilin-type N-terminal cleavage/methylation domain